MGKLEKNIYRITWPIFVEMLFFTLLGTVDTFMLSQFSDTAVGSVGISNQILFLFGIVVNVIALGIGAVAAQYLGAKQVQNAKDTVVTGIIANLFIGIVLTTIVVTFGSIFLRWIGTDASLFVDAETYIKIVGFSLVFVSLRVALSTAFRSFSLNKVVMVIMMIGNLTNIGLNYTLIYGKFGFESMGVAGAAYGTLLSRVLMVILLVIATYKLLDIKLHKVRMKLDQLKRIIKVGGPAALENIMWNITQVIVVAIVNMIGPDTVITRTYIYTLLRFIFIFSFSVATGNSIIVGYHIGEKGYDEAYFHTLKALKIAFVLVVVMTVLMNIFGTEILSLFTKDQDILNMARSVMYIAIFIELGRAMNMVYISALRSAGDTVFPVVMAVISMFGIQALFSYVLGVYFGLGIVGVFIAAMMDEVFRGITMAFRWYRRNWTEIKLID